MNKGILCTQALFSRTGTPVYSTTAEEPTENEGLTHKLCMKKITFLWNTRPGSVW